MEHQHQRHNIMGLCVFAFSFFPFPLALLSIGLISRSFGLYLSASRMQMELFQLLCLRRVLVFFVYVPSITRYKTAVCTMYIAQNDVELPLLVLVILLLLLLGNYLLVF